MMEIVQSTRSRFTPHCRYPRRTCQASVALLAINVVCRGEIGYETAVSVLKVNQAIEAERKLYFKPDEFKV